MIAQDKVRATRAPVVNKMMDTMETNMTMVVLALLSMVVMSLVFGTKFPKTFLMTLVGSVVGGYVYMQKKGMLTKPSKF